MKRLAIILKEDHTLHEMMLGIAAANLLLLAAAFFVTDRNKAICAIVIGLVTALLYVVHLAVTVDDALHLSEEGALASFRKNMIIRYVFVCVVAAISLGSKIADPVFLVISIITIKAGAYLQPTVHKIFFGRNDK